MTQQHNMAREFPQLGDVSGGQRQGAEVLRDHVAGGPAFADARAKIGEAVGELLEADLATARESDPARHGTRRAPKRGGATRMSIVPTRRANSCESD